MGGCCSRVKYDCVLLHCDEAKVGTGCSRAGPHLKVRQGQMLPIASGADGKKDKRVGQQHHDR